MQDFETDRTFSAQDWRMLLASACGVLVIGVGLGVLIGRLIAAPAGPPPASASILPDVSPAPAQAAQELPAVASSDASDEDVDAPAPAAAAASSPVTSPPAMLRTAAPVSPAESVATRTPEPRADSRPKRRVAARQVEARPKSKPKPVPSDARGPRWVVQLGAFQSSDHANLLVNTLAVHGEAAHVTFARNGAGQGWFYVQTPPYRSAAAARGAARSLAAREHLPTYLIKLPPVAG